MSLAMTYYVLNARKWFTGPKINVRYIQGVDSIEFLGGSGTMPSEKDKSG